LELGEVCDEFGVGPCDLQMVDERRGTIGTRDVVNLDLRRRESKRRPDLGDRRAVGRIHGGRDAPSARRWGGMGRKASTGIVFVGMNGGGGESDKQVLRLMVGFACAPLLGPAKVFDVTRTMQVERPNKMHNPR
jgi:hypothetical protein